jgi:hypothetical protein
MTYNREILGLGDDGDTDFSADLPRFMYHLQENLKKKKKLKIGHGRFHQLL